MRVSSCRSWTLSEEPALLSTVMVSTNNYETESFLPAQQIPQFASLSLHSHGKSFSCLGPIVTVTIDSVRFLAPAFAHDALIVSGRVNAVFRSSVEIEVTIEKENLFQDHETRSVCCKGTLVFVHLDPKSRRPLKCPPLKMTTDQEKARSQAALLRKQERAAERSGMVSSNGNNRSSKERILWWKQQWPKEEHDLNALQTFSKITFIETIPENAHKYTATTNKVIMPQHANTLQIAFGGQVMFWMEQAAALAAIRFARKNVITASLDRMSFDKQSKVGDLLSLEAIVTRAFDKSLEVKVRVHSYQAGTTDPVFTNAGFFTFTAVDETQRSVAVGTQVRPVTEETQKDFCEALRRREARLQEKSE